MFVDPSTTGVVGASSMAPLFTAVPIEIISMALGIDEVTNYLGYGVAEVKNVQIAPGVLIFISASARGRQNVHPRAGVKTLQTIPASRLAAIHRPSSSHWSINSSR